MVRFDASIDKITSMNFKRKYKLYLEYLDELDENNPMKEHNEEVIKNLS